jgi:hypothetical protein
MLEGSTGQDHYNGEYAGPSGLFSATGTTSKDISMNPGSDRRELAILDIYRETFRRIVSWLHCRIGPVPNVLYHANSVVLRKIAIGQYRCDDIRKTGELLRIPACLGC